MIKLTMTATLLLAAAAASAQQTPPAAPAQPAMEAERPTPLSTSADVQARLKADGYSNVQPLQAAPDGWRTTATHDGKRYAVKIGRDGKVEKAPM